MRATKSASEQQRTAPEALSLETVEIFETYRPVSLGIGYSGRLLLCILRFARDAVNWRTYLLRRAHEVAWLTWPAPGGPPAHARPFF